MRSQEFSGPWSPFHISVASHLCEDTSLGIPCLQFTQTKLNTLSAASVCAYILQVAEPGVVVRVMYSAMPTLPYKQIILSPLLTPLPTKRGSGLKITSERPFCRHHSESQINLPLCNNH